MVASPNGLIIVSTLNMETACYSETFAPTYLAARYHNPENRNLNFKTHVILATIKAMWIMLFTIVYVPDMNNPSPLLLSQFDHTQLFDVSSC